MGCQGQNLEQLGKFHRINSVATPPPASIQSPVTDRVVTGDSWACLLTQCYRATEEKYPRQIPTLDKFIKSSRQSQEMFPWHSSSPSFCTDNIFPSVFFWAIFSLTPKHPVIVQLLVVKCLEGEFKLFALGGTHINNKQKTGTEPERG